MFCWKIIEVATETAFCGGLFGVCVSWWWWWHGKLSVIYLTRQCVVLHQYLFSCCSWQTCVHVAPSLSLASFLRMRGLVKAWQKSSSCSTVSTTTRTNPWKNDLILYHWKWRCINIPDNGDFASKSNKIFGRFTSKGI